MKVRCRMNLQLNLLWTLNVGDTCYSFLFQNIHKRVRLENGKVSSEFYEVVHTSNLTLLQEGCVVLYLF
jgi:hypothetical protein